MAMVINYLKSYDRSFRKLDNALQEKTSSAIDSFLNFLRTRQKPEGLGLKKVYKNYWEIRLDIKNRIIFELSADTINFAFVGDHNAVKRFLKEVQDKPGRPEEIDLAMDEFETIADAIVHGNIIKIQGGRYVISSH